MTALSWMRYHGTHYVARLSTTVEFCGINRSWWRHQMETCSALLAICAGNSPVPGESAAQRPVTRSFEVFFDLRMNKRLSKQSWGWWFETPSWSLWRHCNVLPCLQLPWGRFQLSLSGQCYIKCKWILYFFEWIQHDRNDLADKWRNSASQNLVIIGSCNGLSLVRRWVTTWTSAELLSIAPLGTNCSGIQIKIRWFSSKKLH